MYIYFCFLTQFSKKIFETKMIPFTFSTYLQRLLNPILLKNFKKKKDNK